MCWGDSVEEAFGISYSQILNYEPEVVDTTTTDASMFSHGCIDHRHQHGPSMNHEHEHGFWWQHRPETSTQSPATP